MKTNAIVRIILFSIAILVLLGILGTVLGMHLFMFRRSEEHHSEATHIPQKIESIDPEDYGAAVQPGEIKNIEIDWVSGNITIAASPDTELITVSESEPEKEANRMVCKQKGSTLTIQYNENQGFIGITDAEEKDLLILVPQDWNCGSVEIQTASADILIQDMSIDELDFDGASGNCRIENSAIGSLDVDAASGDLSFSGTLNTMDFDGASSDCTMILFNSPRSLELDAMSGNLDLTLPQDCGFTAELDGLGTNFSSEFETTKRDHSHVHGNGKCRISLESMSGSITIRKGSEVSHDNQH